jgi:hypothetical protein
LVTDVIRICRIKVSIEPGWRRIEEIYRRKFIANYMGGSTEIMDSQQIKFLARASAQLTDTATNLALIYLSQ